MVRYGRMRLSLAAACLALLLGSFLSGCASGGLTATHSTPESVVRAYIEAVNARDKDKFVSLWPPDFHEYPGWAFDNTWEAKIRYTEVKTILVGGTSSPLDTRQVIVQATIEEDGGPIRDHEFHFMVEQVDGRWYIYAVSDEEWG